MKPDDPRILAVANAVVALMDGLSIDWKGEWASRPAVDELVPLTPAALAARGLEHRAIVRLAEVGDLRTVRIGRRRYTRSSWLAELATKLSGAPIASVPNDGLRASEDLLWSTARKCAERRAARARRT